MSHVERLQPGRDGLVSRVQVFDTRAEAERAAGV
jgi:hypothetical protein